LPAPDVTEPGFGWCGASGGVNIIDIITFGWRRTDAVDIEQDIDIH
jgi:hypothetical protein